MVLLLAWRAWMRRGKDGQGAGGEGEEAEGDRGEEEQQGREKYLKLRNILLLFFRMTLMSVLRYIALRLLKFVKLLQKKLMPYKKKKDPSKTIYSLDQKTHL